jgi:hypothetical protein
MVFGKLIYLANAVLFYKNRNNTAPILKIDRKLWIDNNSTVKQPAIPTYLS